MVKKRLIIQTDFRMMPGQKKFSQKSKSAELRLDEKIVNENHLLDVGSLDVGRFRLLKHEFMNEDCL